MVVFVGMSWELWATARLLDRGVPQESGRAQTDSVLVGPERTSTGYNESRHLGSPQDQTGGRSDLSGTGGVGAIASEDNEIGSHGARARQNNRARCANGNNGAGNRRSSVGTAQTSEPRMRGSHPAEAAAQSPACTFRAGALLPQPVVCQKGIAEHVQKREFGSEVVGEGGCPIHYLAADGSIIHRHKNASRVLLGATSYDKGRDGELPDQALERPASAPVQSLAAQYHEICLEASGYVSQALDGGPHAHLH